MTNRLRLSTVLLFAALLAISLPCRASAKYFHFSTDARSAYAKVTSLRFGEAYALLAQLRLKEPDNLIVHHIENYIDFFTLYINEDESEYKALKARRDQRLDLIKHTGDQQSPYYRFIQADIRLQWALARLRFEDYFGAFTEVSKAHKLLQENDELFPDFLPNKKDLGILHAMVGTIPDNYKWGIKLLGGLEGTIEQGRREIEQVLAKAKGQDFIFEQETQVLYAFLLLHLENQEDEAWKAVANAKLDPRGNPLHCFVMANIAMRSGRNDKAISLLKDRPQGRAYADFPYLDYMLGLAKLRRLDHDAGPYFERYLTQYQGRNFIKEAYQKLAWQSLVKGDEAGYRRHIKSCLQKGYAIAGGDKSAEREALSGQLPELHLLKARLLFDGSYFEQGYQLLSAKPADYFSGARQLEYHYRLGRLLHGMKRYPQAMEQYRFTLEKGSGSPLFYACNAALQIGIIHERHQRMGEARQAYEQCLNLKPEEYRLGLHQKAKAGLARIKGGERGQ